MGRVKGMDVRRVVVEAQRSEGCEHGTGGQLQLLRRSAAAAHRHRRAEEVEVARDAQQRLRRLVDVVAADAAEHLVVRLARVLQVARAEAGA